MLNKMKKPDVTVGVDGSLYRFHPHFHDLMMEKTKLLAPGIRVSYHFFLSSFCYVNVVIICCGHLL